MHVIAGAMVLLVAAMHLYFLVLEMFLWTRPLGLKTFRNTPEKAEAVSERETEVGGCSGRARNAMPL